MTARANGVREGSDCVVADPASVEARFGVYGCKPESPYCCCKFELPGWAVDEVGRLHAGVLAVPLDHVLGEVGFLRRPLGHWSLTTELTLDFMGSGMAPGDVVQAKGAPVRLESKSGFVTGTISDCTGAPMVMATTRTVSVAARSSETPAPHVPQSARNPATLEDYLGFTYQAVAGGVTARLAEPADWTNQFGILHGGVWACLSESVASEAIRSHNGELSTAHLHTSYLRPGIPAAGVNATAEIVHIGARFVLVSVRGHADDGTLCTVSTVTARHIEPSVIEE